VPQKVERHSDQFDDQNASDITVIFVVLRECPTRCPARRSSLKACAFLLTKMPGKGTL
jgi:hypothetical protein